MDEKVKEYNIDGVIVRIYGGQPDRKRLEKAIQVYAKSLLDLGYDPNKLRTE